VSNRSRRNDLRGLGFVSLGIGVALFLLIGLRALQAHREGDQQLRNDSLWVLVSPLVFGSFGLRLLTAAPASGGARRSRAELEPARRALKQAEALAAAVTDSQQGPAHEQLQSQLAELRGELAASRDEAAALERRLQEALRASEARAAALEEQLTGLQQQRDSLAAALVDARETSPAGVVEPDVSAVASTLQTQLKQLEQRCAQLRGEQQTLAQQHQEALLCAKKQWHVQLEELEAEWRHQWQTLDQALHQAVAGARAEHQLAQEQRLSRNAQLEHQLVCLTNELQQAQRSQAALQHQLAGTLSTGELQREQLRQRSTAVAGQVEQASTSLRQQVQQLEGERQQLRRSAEELELLIRRLERSPAATDGSAPAFDGCYEDACGELGVLPGSPWTAVRATWRQGLLRWHPDQGGDPAAWPRRQAAYQLLEAWYAFRQPPGG
jgi:predicted  nucleic acid-binding Zn-ribbon protein